MRDTLERRLSGSRGEFPIIPVFLTGVKRPQDHDLPMFLKLLASFQGLGDLPGGWKFGASVCRPLGTGPGLNVFCEGRTMRTTSWLASVAAGLTIVGLLTAFAVSAPLYGRWINHSPTFAIELAVLLALLFGLDGRDYGIASLFWHEDNWTQFLAGVSVGMLALLLFFLGHLLDPGPEELAAWCAWVITIPGRLMAWVLKQPAPAAAAGSGNAATRLRHELVLMGVPLVLLLTIRQWLALARSDQGAGSSSVRHLWALPLGTLLALVLADLVLRAMPVTHWLRWHGWIVALASVLLLYLLDLAGPPFAGLVTASTVICLLLAEIAFVVFVTDGCPMVRLGLAVAALAGMALFNSDPYKLSYPGLESYAARPRSGRGSHLVPIRYRRGSLSLKVRGEGEEHLLCGLEELDRGVQDYAEGRFAEAACRKMLSECEKAILIDPNAPVYFLARGLAKVLLQDCEGAVSDHDHAADLGGESALLRFNRGQALMCLQRYRQAIADFDATLSDDPEFIRALVFRGKARDAVGEGELAQRDYWAAARATLRWADAWKTGFLRRAGHAEYTGFEDFLPRICEFLQPHDPGAIEFYDHAIASDPTQPYYRLCRGLAYQLAGDQDAANRDLTEAIASYTEMMTSDPTQPYFQLYRGLAYHFAGDQDAAIPDLAKTFRMNPGVSIVPLVESHRGLLIDEEILDRWWLRRFWARPVPAATASPKPKLVVVCVSGGGIVAACWTAMCLTAIECEFPEFPSYIRVITGASGGMVGAAQYVSTLRDPAATDGQRDERELRAIVDSVALESLTPVVRRMVLHDLPSIFSPFDQSWDRGRELERAWEEHSHVGRPRPDDARSGLARTFRDLAPGEIQGWRPSLIVSPLLVEDGARMVISNLDLEDLSGVNLQLFTTFPAARPHLKLSTALRMNAAFPYVTPATSLPTDEPRRVADAGYVDNYGVRLATNWIDRHRDWLLKNTSGVALVQIRAYALGRPDLDFPPERQGGEICRADTGARHALEGPQKSARAGHRGSQSRIGAGLQWLTTPFKGYMTARRTTILSLNWDRVKSLREAFHAETGQEGFFRTFVFECSYPAPLSWMITRSDRQGLEQELHSAYIRQQQQDLIEFLGGKPNQSR